MPDAASPSSPGRMPDGGPIYVETPANLEQYEGLVAEPWNTASALLFIILALAWAWRLRGHYREHVFLTICLPILTAGGIGGVLFHGTRRHHAYFLLDVIPIYFLGLCVSIWLWIRLGPKLRHLLGVIALLAFLQLTALWRLPTHWAINVSYASLALIIVIPVILALVRTRFRHAGWIYTSLACFGIAWACRIADATIRPPLLSMGTHWLWHVFGAATTAALSVYVYRIERIKLR